MVVVMANVMTMMRVGHYIHRRHRSQISSKMLLYRLTATNGDNAESNCQAPHITIQIGAFNAGGFHALVASIVGAIQNNMLDSRVNPTYRVSHRGMRKTGGKNEPEEPRHERVYKNRATRGMTAGLLSPSGVWALPFLSFPLSSETSPSLISQHERSEHSCGCSPLCR